MLKQRCWIGVIAVAILLFTPSANSRPDQFTALVASALTANARPFLGTDGRLHLVYELVLTNTNATPATLQKVEVVDASDPSKSLASYAGQDLLARLQTTGSTAAESPTIEFNGTRLLLIHITLDPASTVPRQLLHRITALAAPGPGRVPTTPVALNYTAAPLDIVRKLPAIGPPLSGARWVAVNGCCEAAGVHRSAGLAVNGKIYFAQRFAIDWMRLDESGRLVHGDTSDVHSYPDYSADVLAVGDGTVVDTVNILEDQKPGTLPDPKTITIENVDGNHVILDLGDGVFALYAHLQKGSVTIAKGERVKRGQVLAKLGNTGNTSGPHLHFQLMEEPSALGSNGIPYAIDSFFFAGQISEVQFAAAPGVEGDWSKGMLRTSDSRQGQFPLDLNIIDFPSAK
jgi:Peptidase family M23